MPEWRVLLLRPARRYLDRLPLAEQERILDALSALGDDPFAAEVKPLQGRPEWSLRIGERRALLRIDRDERTVVVSLIAPRGDVYKR